MNRRSLVGFAALIAAASVLALGGCAAEQNAAQSRPPSASATDSSLVVYSPQGTGPRGDYIASHAQKELGITVTFVSGGGGELTNRLIAEKNNAQADVALGLGEAQMNQLAAADVLSPFTPDWAPLVGKSFRTSKDFTLFSQTPVVMAYNTAAMTETEAPTSWADLADTKYKDTFVFPAITSQTGQAAAVGILWSYADPKTGKVSNEGWDVLTKILKNSYPMSDGQKFDWNWVVSKQQPIVITYLGGLQTGAADNNLDMKIIAAKGGSPFVSAGIGVVRGTSKQATAERFVNWFGSATFQTGFVTATNNDTPTNKDAISELPEAEAALKEIQNQDIDWSVASRNLSDWLQRIQLDIVG